MPNQKIVAELVNWHFPEPIPLRTSNLRAPGDIARCFASESLIDEIAADLKVDPVEFRLNNLTGNKRAHRMLAGRRRQSRLAKTAVAGACRRAATSQEDAASPSPSAPTPFVATVAEVEVNKTTGQVAVNASCAPTTAVS